MQEKIKKMSRDTGIDVNYFAQMPESLLSVVVLYYYTNKLFADGLRRFGVEFLEEFQQND